MHKNNIIECVSSFFINMKVKNKRECNKINNGATIVAPVVNDGLCALCAH